jgi:uncharacterized protein (DUF2384 family)
MSTAKSPGSTPAAKSKSASAAKPATAAESPIAGVIQHSGEYGVVHDVFETAMEFHVHEFRAKLRRAPLAARVKLERFGVPAGIVKGLIKEIGVGTVEFQRFVGIPKATFTKKMKGKSLFAGTSGQSVVGLMDLINAVEDMLAAEKDNPEAKDFDVAKWVGEWIERPQPALGGLAPAELMDTPSGRESVMKVLGAIQSGAFQ